jgi:hypothetical protein
MARVSTAIVGTFGALADQLNNAKSTLVARKTPLVNECAALHAERHALETAPVPVEDARQLLFDLIDRRGMIFAERVDIAGIFARALYPPMIAAIQKRPWSGCNALNLRDIESIMAGDSGTLEDRPMIGVLGDTEGALCYFLGDAIKAKLSQEWTVQPARHLNADVAHVGAPARERRKRLRTIEARLAEIATECGSLDRESAALGVELAAIDLIEPAAGHAKRDATILARYNKRTWNTRVVCELYGLSPDYAEYLCRKAEQ